MVKRNGRDINAEKKRASFFFSTYRTPLLHRKLKALSSVLPTALQITQRYFAQSRNLIYFKQLATLDSKCAVTFFNFQYNENNSTKCKATMVHDKLKGYAACIAPRTPLTKMMTTQDTKQYEKKCSGTSQSNILLQ